MDLVTELKKQGNMKVAVIPFVFDALGMVPKSLERNWCNQRP